MAICFLGYKSIYAPVFIVTVKCFNFWGWFRELVYCVVFALVSSENFVLQFPLSLKQEGSASLATWRVQIPGKIITELSMRRSVQPRD